MKLLLLFFAFFNLASYSQPTDFNQLNFQKADSVALSYKGEGLNNLPVLTHNLTANLTTDVEKFRAIYTWVSTNIENDYQSYATTSNKRKKIVKDREAFLKWNSDYSPKMFEKLISQKKTACTGYAYLIREMAQLAEIACKIVDGYGRTATTNLSTKSQANHSWNIVKLNNKWYLCDATWSAGKTMMEEKGAVFTFDYNDGYFLADTELFIKNHYPLQIENTLLAENPTFKEFLEGPIIYNDAFKQNVIPIAPQKMKFEVLKHEPVSFRFKHSHKEAISNINIQLNKNTSNEENVIKTELPNNEVNLSYQFSSSGLYDVHIKIDDAIIVTYVVKVRRK